MYTGSHVHYSAFNRKGWKGDKWNEFMEFGGNNLWKDKERFEKWRLEVNISNGDLRKCNRCKRIWCVKEGFFDSSMIKINEGECTACFFVILIRHSKKVWMLNSIKKNNLRLFRNLINPWSKSLLPNLF